MGQWGGWLSLWVCMQSEPIREFVCEVFGSFLLSHFLKQARALSLSLPLRSQSSYLCVSASSCSVCDCMLRGWTQSPPWPSWLSKGRLSNSPRDPNADGVSSEGKSLWQLCCFRFTVAPWSFLILPMQLTTFYQAVWLSNALVSDGVTFLIESWITVNPRTGFVLVLLDFFHFFCGRFLDSSF